MKMLLQMLLSMLFVVTASGHDPIVPWPLDVNREYIESQDIVGTWVALDRINNKLWYLKITKPPIRSNTSVTISLLGKGFSKPQMGWLVPVDGVYAGKITTSKDQESPLMIFKNLDGLYLRLETEKEEYQDFILYRIYLSPRFKKTPKDLRLPGRA
ncbi:MAG TPA: hypothetical protein VIG33_16455 [Pseudobdellovibrionaceae bacterium]|jgi:hypothetical protein